MRVDERCSSGDKKGVGVRVEEQRRKKSSRRAQLEPGGM